MTRRLKVHKATAKLACMVLFLASLPPMIDAHEDDRDDSVPARVLGELSFPTTTSEPDAQKAFIEGMLLLHLFEYPHARDAFRRARELDPEFAMAYWGEAMTHNHPIWDEQNLQAARDVMHRLGATPEERSSRTSAARELGLITSLEILFGPGDKAERDRRYLRYMEQLAGRFQHDHEIQLFYALALLGVNAGVRDVPSYMMATAIAQSVFSDNPKHPGAAHYLIHGVDDPVHAVLGLEAARALAEMAPDAGHSLHMTSHIFTALGMWDDVVDANLRAVEVQNALRAERGIEPRHWGHYNFWLLYGYLQQGRHDKARELLLAARAEERAHNQAPADRMILDADRSLPGSVVQMWLRYLVETRQWDGDIADWSFNVGDAFDPNLSLSFVKGIRAAHAGQVSVVRGQLDQFEALQGELKAAIDTLDERAPKHDLYLQRLEVMRHMLLAGVEMARGEKSAATRLAARASELEGQMPYSFGPPYVDLPSAEFHAERLMDEGLFRDAAEAYRVQLERSRLRAQSLLGIAWAQIRSENAESAAYYRNKLNTVWRGADLRIRALVDNIPE